MPLKRKINNTKLTASHPVFQQRLKNGIEVLIERIESTQTAAIGFWFACGSRYESDSERGISHFTEHLLFKGTKTRSAYDIAAAFDRMGSYVNAFTEREQVCLHCVVPAGHTAAALEILCDMTENSTMPPEETERERMVIESEIISSLDDPEEAAIDAVVKTLWHGDAVSAPILGKRKDIKKLSRAALVDWYTRYFVQGRLTVCISGAVDCAKICEDLEHLCQKREPALQMPFCTPKWKKGVFFLSADFQQEQLFLLYPLEFPIDQTEYYAWAVLNALIGDTMSSRLFQALRERGGYCYNVYSFFSLFSNCGYWCAYASASKKNIVSAAAIMQIELEKVLDAGFSDDEILAAKEHICGEEIINFEDVEQRMKRLARNWYLNFPQSTLDETILNIRNIDKKTLVQSVKKLIAADKKTVIVYGPDISERSKKVIGK